MTSEEWRDIPGYEGYYQASSLGQIRSVDRRVMRRGRSGQIGSLFKSGQLLKPQAGEGNYRHLRIPLKRDGKLRTWTVHSLVAITFLGLRPTGMEVCHNDGDWQNNRLENLRYDTHGNNVLDSVRHGTHGSTRKTECPLGHSLRGANLQAGKLARNRRACRSCGCANYWVYKLKKRKGIHVTDTERRSYADEKYAEFMGVKCQS